MTKKKSFIFKMTLLALLLACIVGFFVSLAPSTSDASAEAETDDVMLLSTQTGSSGIFFEHTDIGFKGKRSSGTLSLVGEENITEGDDGRLYFDFRFYISPNDDTSVENYLNYKDKGISIRYLCYFAFAPSYVSLNTIVSNISYNMFETDDGTVDGVVKNEVGIYQIKTGVGGTSFYARIFDYPYSAGNSYKAYVISVSYPLINPQTPTLIEGQCLSVDFNETKAKEYATQKLESVPSGSESDNKNRRKYQKVLGIYNDEKDIPITVNYKGYGENENSAKIIDKQYTFYVNSLYSQSAYYVKQKLKETGFSQTSDFNVVNNDMSLDGAGKLLNNKTTTLEALDLEYSYVGTINGTITVVYDLVTANDVPFIVSSNSEEFSELNACLYCGKIVGDGTKGTLTFDYVTIEAIVANTLHWFFEIDPEEIRFSEGDGITVEKTDTAVIVYYDLEKQDALMNLGLHYTGEVQEARLYDVNLKYKGFLFAGDITQSKIYYTYFIYLDGTSTAPCLNNEGAKSWFKKLSDNLFGDGDKGKTILIIGCIIVSVILLFVLNHYFPIFKYIGIGIKWLFIGLWWVIKSPYLLVKWIVGLFKKE